MEIISLGWGVQSFTLAAMAAFGDLDARIAIHSDTTWERADTYTFAKEWTPWLRERGVKVFTVLPAENSRLPVFHVRQPAVAGKNTGLCIPGFMIDPNGKKGQLRRQCTDRWKIKPLRQLVSQALKKRGISKRPSIITLYLGISMDEFERARDSGVRYIKNAFPLLDRRMTRQDCARYLTDHGLPVPPKSSCVFCPYHNAAAWTELKDHPEDLETAVKVDEMIRDARPPYALYVHPSRKPLREALNLPVLEDGCPGGYCFL